MNLLGPKSLSSNLYWCVVGALVLILLLISGIFAVGIFAPTSLPHLMFSVQCGPLHIAVPQQGPETRWWALSLGLISWTAAVVILFALARILNRLRAGEPFDSKTPNRLRVIGWTVIAASLLRSVFCFVLLPNTGGVADSGLRVNAAFDVDSIFLGAVLLVLVEIFRRGYALKNESDFTV